MAELGAELSGPAVLLSSSIDPCPALAPLQSHGSCSVSGSAHAGVPPAMSLPTLPPVLCFALLFLWPMGKRIFYAAAAALP